LAHACAALVAGVFVIGCGSTASQGSNPILSQESNRTLTASQAKRLLQQLPYHYQFRSVALPRGASGALAGTAIGRHHTVLHFGLALGQKPGPVPVPRAGTKGVYGYGGYIYTDDLEVPGKREKWEPGPQFQTEAQWNEAGHMEVQMEEQLCKAETGEPCHE
jgi:hypothetical protein